MHYRADMAALQIREAGDGEATVEGIVVPYDEVTDISEYRPDGPIDYREVFRLGAFASICAANVAHRVALTYNHDESRPNRLGYGVRFAERPDGLHGTFKLDRSQADHARDILSTSHGAFSVGFVSIRPAPGTERTGQLVERTRAALLHVAAVPTGFAAYKSALVGSMREAMELDADQVEAARSRSLLAELDALAARQSDWDSLLKGR